MAELTGANAYIYFKGTPIHGDFRELKDSAKIGLVDASAGADAAETFLTTLLGGEASLNALWQDTTSGDAVYLLCAPGAEGDLQIGPGGSGGGQPWTKVNAIVESVDRTVPYKDVIELDIKFTRSGTPSEGTF